MLKKIAAAASILASLSACLGLPGCASAPELPGYTLTTDGCKIFDYDTNWLDNAAHTTRYKWSGACKHGYAEGAGTLKAYMDGSLDETTVTPESGMVQGKLTGQLHTSYRVQQDTEFGSGSYDGLYTDGRRTGHGEEHHSSGESYSGNFLEGHRSGYGVYRFPNGSRFEGSSMLDRFTGQGKLIDPDGSIIEGIFVESDINGPCTITWPSGSTWQGQCINTVPQIQGSNLP